VAIIIIAAQRAATKRGRGVFFDRNISRPLEFNGGLSKEVFWFL
jgi:hypothetical protein